MAPELYINENKISSSELYKCDVYSLGVLAFEIVFGEVPYNFPKLPVN
jgi:serine/threonine protein kinase